MYNKREEVVKRVARPKEGTQGRECNCLETSPSLGSAAPCQFTGLLVPCSRPSSSIMRMTGHHPQTDMSPSPPERSQIRVPVMLP